MTAGTQRGGKPIRLGLIADDLTGANDTGVQFARCGARTIVPLDWHDLETLGRDADVLALNTNSRALSPRVAAQRARVAAEALRKAGVEAVYKKIDSTFRGNVGAELDAILTVYRVPLAILTPAFPPAGRAVRDGILTVRGIPVHRTSIGKDPVTPVRESHLPTVLLRQCRRPVYSLSLAALRGRVAAQAKLLASWRAQETGLIVADATTATDLGRLARLLLREELFGVVAGSAGLAEALSRALPWRRRTGRSVPDGKGPALVVVGSPNPASLEQIAWAEGREQVPVVRAALREILGSEERYRHELDRVVRKLRPELAADRDAILTLEQPAPDAPQPTLRPTASRTLSEFLGQATSRLAAGGPVGGLVLCGGDIAMAACGALGARGIELRGEVEPGVPWGRLVQGEMSGLPTVTKAGGFGQPSAFARAVRFLRRRTPAR